MKKLLGTLVFIVLPVMLFAMELPPPPTAQAGDDAKITITVGEARQANYTKAIADIALKQVAIDEKTLADKNKLIDDDILSTLQKSNYARDMYRNLAIGGGVAIVLETVLFYLSIHK